MAAPQPFDWQLPTIAEDRAQFLRRTQRRSAAGRPPWEPTPPSSFGRDTIVTLLVGADEQELVAHKHFLTRHSPFFQAALQKTWAEGQESIVKLPEEKLEIVAAYLDYSYSGKLPTESTTLVISNANAYNVLADLYVLGERLQDKKVRNAIADEVLKFNGAYVKGTVRENPMDYAITTIYDGTTEGHPARRLLVDLFLYKGEWRWVREISQNDFLVDVATTSMAELTVKFYPVDFRLALGRDYYV